MTEYAATTDYFDLSDVRIGIIGQAEHCAANGAAVTARICRAQLAMLASDTACGARLRGWAGKVLEDALPLRIAGGLHWLHLTGCDDRLRAVYVGEETDQAAVDAAVMALVRDHDSMLLPWFDSPPQTNEAGRSASFMAGLAWLSGRVGPRFALNELGASAGINTMMDRYFYDLGGVRFGPADSPMRIIPEWRGSAPPAAPVEIVNVRGCDQQIIDLSDPDAAMRVKAYVWPENKERLTRMDAAIRIAAEQAPDLIQADAADWVETVLGEPQQHGVCRVVHHSIVWQYIPAERRAAITAMIEAAGAAATTEQPLAWMMLETNRSTLRHELSVRYWPGGSEPTLLGEAQAHGAWVEWLGVP
jgi:hypothetical protein